MKRALDDGPALPFRAAVLAELRDSAVAYWDNFVALSAGRVAAVVWRGNQLDAELLVCRKPFSLSVADGNRAPAIVDGATFVTERLLRRYFEPSLVALGTVLERLDAARAVLVVGTPPPNRDRWIRSALQVHHKLRRGLEEQGFDPRDLPLLPEPTRLALWTVLQRMLEEVAGDHGATFVAVPAAARDDDGFLREEYALPDNATHANAAYGGLMWASIHEALAARAA